MDRIIWSLIVFLLILATLPPGLYIFSNRRLRLKTFSAIFVNYRWHILVIFAIYAMKSIADLLNDPLRDSLHLDFTPVVYAIEGDATLHVQNLLMNNGLTIFLAVAYTLGFLFVFNFSFVLYAYEDDRCLVNKIVFVNLVLTVMSLVFFLFIPVFVTSWPAMDHSLDPYASAASGIPGMRPLLYHLKPWITDFFYAHDTFDNCLPSLHIAMPLAMTTLLYGAYKATGKRQNEGHGEHQGWRECGRGHTAYFVFLACLTCLISISIIYLGIHWFIDIIAGMVLVPPALWLADRYDERFFIRLNRKLDAIWDRAKTLIPWKSSRCRK